METRRLGLRNSSVHFPVWALRTDLPWHDDRPGDDDRSGSLNSVSVFYGKPFAEGPGAVVTSYNPQLRWADADPEQGAVMRGPFALVRPIALMFKEAYAQQTGLTVAEATELLKAPEHSVLRDAVIQCDKMLVPALELVIRISSVSVFVSADLLTHPAALAWWRCKAKSPVLDRLVI